MPTATTDFPILDPMIPLTLHPTMAHQKTLAPIMEHQNTGHQNTGHQNTDHRNMDHRNTDHRNMVIPLIPVPKVVMDLNIHHMDHHMVMIPSHPILN